MIFAVAALVSAAAVGLLISLAIAPRLSLRTTVGVAILLGIGVTTIILLSLSLVSQPWSPISVTCIALVVAGGALFVAFKRRAEREVLPGSRIAVLVELLAYLPIVAYARWVMAAPVTQGDFWAIWGLKARLFWENQGIDWNFLRTVKGTFSHPDYPPLFPLALDYLTLMRGEWNESAVTLLYVAVAVALLLIVRDAAVRHLGSPVAAALLTIALSTFAVTKWIGLAENVFLAFASASVLLLRDASHSDDRNMLTLASVLLGFAAMTKNEGQALVTAAFLAFLLQDRFSVKRIWRLWPALALALLWRLVRPRGLSVDLVEGDPWARATERLSNAEVWKPVLDFLIPYQEKVWIGAAIAILAAGLGFLRRERFVLITLLLQLMFCLGAYLVTPRDLKWHVATTWQRITAQWTLLVAFIGLIAAFEAIRAFARIARHPAPKETAV